jgi:nascent polypeptide-associated complex subunit beta
MDSEHQKVLDARKKLSDKFGKTSKIGGKGTQKRKNLNKKKTVATDKNIKNLATKLGAQKLPDITNINLFTEDNKVIQFKTPEVMGSFQNQTIIVTGQSETHDIKDCFADVITEIGPKQLEQLKKGNFVPQSDNTKKDQPELVNFEEEANK